MFEKRNDGIRCPSFRDAAEAFAPGWSRRALLALGAAVLFPRLLKPAMAGTAGREPVNVDLSQLAFGQNAVVWWGDWPVFIERWSEKMIRNAEEQVISNMPHPAGVSCRIQNGEWLVLTVLCTHSSCVPARQEPPLGGWMCACHGSRFDRLGRVLRGPASTNLWIPPTRFVSKTRLIIG